MIHTHFATPSTTEYTEMVLILLKKKCEIVKSRGLFAKTADYWNIPAGVEFLNILMTNN